MKINPILRCALIAVAVTANVFGANAANQGSVAGTVRDGDGKPLSGASVRLSNLETHQVAYRAISGPSGEFRFAELTDGAYSLSAELSGYNAAGPVIVRVHSNSLAVAADLTLTRVSATAESGAFASDATDASHPKPEFQAAGIRGLIDPGGYSASSNGAASGILRGIADIKRTDKSFGASAAKDFPCGLETELRSAVAEFPDQANPNLRLGEFYVVHDQPAQAIPFLKRSLEIDGTNDDASRELAIAFLQSGEFENARKTLSPLENRDTTPEAHQLLARAAEGSGMFQQAAQEYRAAYNMESSEESLFGEGYELILAGSPAEGNIAFEAGVKRYPQSIALRVGAGTAQFLLGNTSTALRCFLDAADIDPTDPRPYPFVASASGISHDEEERVRNSFKRYLDRKPDSGLANYFYALALSRESGGVDAGRIETLLKRAIQLDPNLAKAHLQLADLYAQRDDYADAVPEYEAAVRLAQGLNEVHYRLAMAYKHIGRTEQSAREMEIFQLSKQRQAEANAGQGIDIAQFISVMDAPHRPGNQEIQCPATPH